MTRVFSPAINGSSSEPARSTNIPSVQNWFKPDAVGQDWTPVDSEFCNAIIKMLINVKDEFSLQDQVPVTETVLVDGFRALRDELNIAIDYARRNIINIKEFQVVPNSVDDQRQLIQNAEDAAHALFVSTGARQKLYWPSGIYRIKESIIKKAGVEWHGEGVIQRWDLDQGSPGTDPAYQYALVYSEDKNYIKFNGVTFKTLTHIQLHNLGIPRKGSGSPYPGTWNSCIHFNGGEHVEVEGCRFKGFSQGIAYQGLKHYRFANNYLDDESGLSVDSMLDGTYESNLPGGYFYTGTGGIINLFPSSPLVRTSDYGIITNNFCKTPSLDIGIETHNQVYQMQPCVTQGNIIVGARSAIQCYKGSVDDLGTPAPYDYNSHNLIANNIIFGTWEQGIYIRGQMGVQALCNLVLHAGQIGTNGSGTSAGGIVTRVNPFDADPTTIFLDRANQSRAVPVTIAQNHIINPGRPNVALDGALQLRADRSHAYFNHLSRNEHLYPQNTNSSLWGKGIFSENGEKIQELVCVGNNVRNFERGFNHTAGSFADAKRLVFRDNIFDDCYHSATIVPRAICGFEIENNKFNNTERGLFLSHAPFSKIALNEYTDGNQGLVIGEGCLSSDVLAIKTDGTITGSKRRGGTLHIEDNRYNRVTTPHFANNTGTDDATVRGRTIKMSGEIIDGIEYDSRKWSSALPAQANNEPKTFNSSDVTIAANATPGLRYSMICTKSGTFGASVATTGNVTNGSNQITNVADYNGIGPWQYLNFNNELAYIVSIDSSDADPLNWIITLDRNLNATLENAPITSAAPEFIDYQYLKTYNPQRFNDEDGTPHVFAALNAWESTNVSVNFTLDVDTIVQSVIGFHNGSDGTMFGRIRFDVTRLDNGSLDTRRSDGTFLGTNASDNTTGQYGSAADITLLPAGSVIATLELYLRSNGNVNTVPYTQPHAHPQGGIFGNKRMAVTF